MDWAPHLRPGREILAKSDADTPDTRRHGRLHRIFHDAVFSFHSDCATCSVLPNALVLQPDSRDELIQRIGTEIGRRGSCLVAEEDLAVLYDGAVEESKRFACIRDMAFACRWSFEFPGRSNSVNFRNLPPEEATSPAGRSAVRV